MLHHLHIGIAILLAALTIKYVPMNQKQDHPKVRMPAVAGAFYPATAKEIRTMVSLWLHPCEDSPTPQAIIVPHAGYVFSGEVAASAYSRIPLGHAYKRIFLIGPSHRVGFAGASVDTLYDYAATPLGNVKIDTALGEELIRNGDGAFTCRADAHDREHCLDVQLPFLQMVFKEVPPIVPIVVGTQRLGVLREIAEVLGPYFCDENLFVISSDFSHYPGYEDARKSDLFLADAITKGNLDVFLKALSEVIAKDYPGEDTPACGASAIAILLAMMDAQVRDSFTVDHVMYKNSGDSPYGDRDAVVGYNAIAVTRTGDQVFHFTDEEKSRMVATARSAIYKKLGLDFDGDESPVGILKEKGYGVFVSLHLDGGLRGCIGRFTSDETLAATIREMALSAAFSDPRFPALSKREAPKVEIEVSVLSLTHRSFD